MLLVALLASASAHSWLDCMDYDCPGAGANAGPQQPGACTCKGYARNWNNVMAGVPFAGDRGRDNRPGPNLVCDAGKEPNPGAGTGTPAGMYNAQYPMATLTQGQTVRWRWPAKNHANTPNAGNVEVYIASQPNAGDVFPPGPGNPYAVMSYSSDNGDCLGINQDTDTADCQGTWTLGTDVAPGRYTIMWWWEFNPGEFYNSCADVNIAAGSGAGPGPGAGTPGNPGNFTPPPAVTPTTISFTVSITASTAEFGLAAQSSYRERLGGMLFGVTAADITVTVTPQGATTLQVVTVVTTSNAARAADVKKVVETWTPAALTTVIGHPVTSISAPTVVALSGGGGGGGSNTGMIAGIVIVVVLLVVILIAWYIHSKNRKGGASTAPPAPVWQKGASFTGLPDGWTSAVDPASGVTYYINVATGASTWTHPRVSDRGAPPPPPGRV